MSTPAAHPLPVGTDRRQAPRPRATVLPALLVSLLLAFVAALGPVGAASAHIAPRAAVGEWHRLNPAGEAAPQHEHLTCVERRTWRCRFDHLAEPTLEARGTVARINLHTVTSRWECPEWFAEHCDDVVEVLRGKGRVVLDDGTKFTVTDEFILTEADGQEVLWIHIVDFGIVAPWYRTFDEAVRAAGFEPPYRFDGTNWPAEDWIVVP